MSTDGDSRSNWGDDSPTKVRVDALTSWGDSDPIQPPEDAPTRPSDVAAHIEALVPRPSPAPDISWGDDEP